MNIEKTCSACNGYGIDPRCPICNQAKQSAFLRDVGVFKPTPITERNTAVPPAPTFADGMTTEDDRRFLELTNDLTHNAGVTGLAPGKDDK